MAGPLSLVEWAGHEVSAGEHWVEHEVVGGLTKAEREILGAWREIHRLQAELRAILSRPRPWSAL